MDGYMYHMAKINTLLIALWFPPISGHERVPAGRDDRVQSVCVCCHQLTNSMILENLHPAF